MILHLARVSRAALCVVVIGLGFGFAHITTVRAADFGGNWISNSVGTLTGTRSQIQSPGYNIFSSDGGLIIMRVSLESGFTTGCTSGCGLIQTGFGTTSSGFDACGSRTSNTTFYEYKATYGTYTCQWLSTFGSTSTDYKYSVVRIAASCTSCYDVFIGGTLQYTSGALGFSSGDHAYAEGEFSDSTGGTTYGCYGCVSGDMPWQYTGGLYGQNPSYTTILSATQQNTDGKWYVQGPPSPFQVSH